MLSTRLREANASSQPNETRGLKRPGRSELQDELPRNKRGSRNTYGSYTFCTIVVDLISVSMKTNFVKGDCWQSVVSVVPPKLILRTRQLRKLLLDVVNPQTGNELPEDYYVMGLEIRFLCQQDVSPLC